MTITRPSTRRSIAIASSVALAVVASCTPSSPRGTAAGASQEPPSSCVLPPPASASSAVSPPTSVVGAPLETCSMSPLTGVHRDGRCATGPDDTGVHVVCAAVTSEFLDFTVARGNDLVTPARGFPGLKPGDRWCLCAARWAEADAAGVAPPVVLAATEAAALRTIARPRLESHALR